MHPGRLHLTAAVVEYRTPWKRKRKGLFTTWLRDAQAGPQGAIVPTWVVPGTVRLPEDRRVGGVWDSLTARGLVKNRLGSSPETPFLREKRSSPTPFQLGET